MLRELLNAWMAASPDRTYRQVAKWTGIEHSCLHRFCKGGTMSEKALARLLIWLLDEQ